MIKVDETTGPVHFASALINGDSSGLSDEDEACLDAFVERLEREGWYVVDVVEGSERFTWSYDLHGGTARGGNVVDYIIHKQVEDQRS